MNRLTLSILLGLALVLSACATKSYSPDNAPEYSVIRNFTPFFKNGPMQAGGPNASLTVGTRVKLMRDEMGYSLVLLDDGRTGYVANESIAPAPPRPSEPKLDSDDVAVTGSSKKRRGGPNSPRYTGEQLNDIPLPDPNVPPPDLNVAPEEVTAPAPTPTPQSEKPKFRY